MWRGEVEGRDVWYDVGEAVERGGTGRGWGAPTGGWGMGDGVRKERLFGVRDAGCECGGGKRLWEDDWLLGKLERMCFWRIFGGCVSEAELRITREGCEGFLSGEGGVCGFARWWKFVRV